MGNYPRCPDCGSYNVHPCPGGWWWCGCCGHRFKLAVTTWTASSTDNVDVGDVVEIDEDG